ncbi:glycosyltransferase [Candidatus Woesearchaeota archaeon]|nr:glycosyltransferase [Candidatus Woesearchaeota archaeon]
MISIIVPTFNEAKNIEKLVDRINKVMENERFEIIVVDDNSPDNTWKIAKELPKDKHVRVLRRIGKSGLSSAVVDGFKIAKGDLIGVIDADLSHPPEVIPDIVRRIREGEADMIIGSRLVKGGGTEGWPAHRKLTSKIATLLARPVTHIKDPMSGFFFFRKEVIEGAELKPKGYKIGLEIIVKGNAKKVLEHPIMFKDRTAGQSKLGMKQNMEYLLQLADLYIHKIKKKIRGK